MKLEELDDDAVVISGISGKFPNSDNINELIANLLKGEDCVTSYNPRWQFEHPKVPSRIGTISQINKFDNVCFGINEKHSYYIDPIIKLVMETTFEAIVDAGINPVELKKNKNKTNVYGSFSFSESNKFFFSEKLHYNGHYLIGCCNNFLPNRLSYYFNLIGSSCLFDSYSSSTASAMQKAYENLKSGECEYAIISAGVLSLHPESSYHQFELDLLSSDGINRSFDDKANGFTRSESIGSLFLQKAKHAKRIYAEVVNICSMFGESIPRNTCLFPLAKFQAEIMKQTLKHAGLKPSDINYIEADGTPIKSMIYEELKAIDLVYGQNRSSSNPLLIGSIKSNIGYTYTNNTINSILKVLIAMETGVIPPNINYEKPLEDATCLQDGRVKVVTKPTPWTDNYAVVNTTSLNGIFSSIILKRHSKEKQKKELLQDNVPRLFVISCRSKEMISSFFNILKQNRGDVELAQFINDVTEVPFPYSLYSGYTVISQFEEADSNKETEMIQEISIQSRQIWFVFSGMGSQWTGMGESLMRIPIFAEAIKKCDVILRPHGYDIVNIICSKDPTIYDNILNCFLGIAAIQIGLVDILYAVDLKPNFIIGHSVGEMGCAYADGCFTPEEMILSALSRGLASIKSDLIHGTMAAVGLGYHEIRDLCPEDIDVACHNGTGSSTISGPTESINAFVKELQSKGIFATTVPTANIAYHSRYISPAGPKLLDSLRKVIPEPKSRSKRWISTSVPKDKWHTKEARFCSPEYHTNNLLSPVLFEEVLKMIPKNAITIEISPHGLLQAILRKSLDSNCINLSLTNRKNKDNATLILITLGKLYNLGYPIKPGKLYPKVPYPVSRGTSSISSLLKWEHQTDWFVNTYQMSKIKPTAERLVILDLESDEYKFLQDFKINNKIFIPLGIYLKIVVNIYSSLITKMADSSFILENIIIHKELIKVSKKNKIPLNIIVFTASKIFEVRIEDNTIILGGTIRLIKNRNKEISEVILLKEEMESLYEEDIYKNLLLRGYKYNESCKLISRLSASCSNGILKWSDDWGLLLEALIQIHIVNNKNKNIVMPNRIQKIIIDMEKFTDQEMIENNAIPMKFEKRVNMMSCPGLTMIGIEFKEIITKNENWEIVADELRFIQNMNERDMDMDDVCNVVLGLISKNISTNSTDNIIVTKESKYENENIIEYLSNIIKRREENFNVKLIAKELLNQTMNENFILMIINNAHFNDVRKFINMSGSESFLLIFIPTEDEDNMIATLTNVELNVILKIKITLRRTALLLQKKEKKLRKMVINTQEDYIDWLKISLRNSKYDNVILLVNTTIENNLLEILRDIKREPGYEKLQIFDLQDAKAPKFSLQNEFYEYQIKLNLRENVLSPNGVWGTYRWMPLSMKSTSSSRWQAKMNKSGSLEWVAALPLIKEKNKNVVKMEYAAFDLNVYEYWLKSDVSFESQVSITEYSGTDEKGRRIMGLVENFTISNEILPDPDFTWIIPDTLTFAEAATIPQAYLAAFCVLHLNVRFKDIKNILIHFGASDVGQALINLSLSYHLNVYTTYETEAEKRVIESMRPRLPQSHIINIENYNINMIHIMKNKTVDLIVASYAILDDIDSSLEIIDTSQHLVILHDLKERKYNPVKLGNFVKNISIYSYHLQDFIKLPPTKKKELAELMRTALQAGTLKPIISRRLQLQGTTELFQEKKMAACERYGKVLVNLQEQKKLPEFNPQFFFHSDKCYFIIEGFNTFGSELIEWMIEQGVRKLFITSNKSIQDYKNRVHKWCESGITVIVRDEVDISDVTRFENLLKEATSMGQLDGIFDLQRTKMNSSIPSLKYSEVTKALDKYSRKFCPLHVKFFVFSSLDLDEDGLRDLTVEKICKERKESDLHGLFILLPNFVEKVPTETEFKNIYYKKISLLLQQLGTLLSTNASVIAVRYIMKDNSDEETDIDAETDEKQISMDPQEEEMKNFEQYIYSDIKQLKFFCE